MPSDNFVNHGLQRWEKLRKEWVGKDGTESETSSELKAKRIVNVENVIERLFNQSHGGELLEPLPLCQMVDILTDLWEADGAFD